MDHLEAEEEDEESPIQVGDDDDDNSPAFLPEKCRSMPNMSKTMYVDGNAVDPPSKGSMLHPTKDCTPCAWFWKPMKCHNAKDCNYCHLCPEGELKTRKKVKQQAMRNPVGAAVTPTGGQRPATPLNLDEMLPL